VSWTGRLVTRVAGLIAPALLIAVALLVHGTTPHGHRAGAAVVSAQAWQLNPAVQAAGHPSGSHAPGECPQPFDDCDAGLAGAQTPLTSAGASPLHRSVVEPSSGAVLFAVLWRSQGSPPIRPDQTLQAAGQPELAQSQVYRC
jgi:hypothetical protein